MITKDASTLLKNFLPIYDPYFLIPNGFNNRWPKNQNCPSHTTSGHWHRNKQDWTVTYPSSYISDGLVFDAQSVKNKYSFRDYGHDSKNDPTNKELDLKTIQ